VRAEGRLACALLRSLAAVRDHRGGALSRLGAALSAALSAPEVPAPAAADAPVWQGAWFPLNPPVPERVDVPLGRRNLAPFAAPAVESGGYPLEVASCTGGWVSLPDASVGGGPASEAPRARLVVPDPAWTGASLRFEQGLHFGALLACLRGPAALTELESVLRGGPPVARASAAPTSAAGVFDPAWWAQLAA
jgi:hypothetical protein